MNITLYRTVCISGILSTKKLYPLD